MNNRTSADSLLSIAAVILCMSLLVSLVSCTGEDDEEEDWAIGDGTVYYVAPDGDNDGPGTEDMSWRTIQRAAATLEAGHTVFIMAGTYRERVVLENSGTPDNYIVYTARPGDVVTIDGKGMSLPSDDSGLIEVSDVSYIRISGLRVMNSGPNENNVGILVDGSRHIIIEDNYIYNTVSSGIGVWDCSNIVIDGNEVELACNDGEQECITVASTDTFEIRNNHVHHGGPGTNGGEGIDAKDGSSNGKIYGNHVHHTNADRTGIYMDSWDKHTFNIAVYQNIVHACSAGITLASEMGGLLENIQIYNNIAYNNKVNGFEIGGWGEEGIARHPVSNVGFMNNTAYKNGVDWGGGIFIENPDAENIVIRNNIVSQNLMFQIADESSLEDLVVDHNLIDGYRGYDGEIQGNDHVAGNPGFVDPANGDFHLQMNSPAIDSGSADEAPDSDFSGTSRPKGSGHDMGAFEF